jgi:hypothetical protein
MEDAMKRKRWVLFLLAGLSVTFLTGAPASALDQRDEVSYLRGPYNIAFYHRHNEAYRISSTIHFAHGLQHDILQLEDFSKHLATDIETDAEYLEFLYNPPRTEPKMEYYGPYIARVMFDLYRAIDWTHMHHEQTYDILSQKSIPWSEKKSWTDRSVRYYLDKFDIPRSPAPLDVTLRRAGTMMKPYTGYFRNYYPRSNNFFFAAHWWHPVIYEAMMMGGNDNEQETMVKQTDGTYFSQVIPNRPQRMLLSREAMPRYSRMSPESANIFDNLHMLHGIAYDILAYPKWSLEEKRKEMYRVIKAMSYQPGDEKLARKFKTEHPQMDPRIYYEWLQGVEGDMNRIMLEMMHEMMPKMMPQGMTMTDEMKKKMEEQFYKKMTPGIQEGEFPGSLLEAMQQMMPDMKVSEDTLTPGATPTQMVETMLAGWEKKHGSMPDIAPISLDTDPSAPPLPAEAEKSGRKELHIQNTTPY